VGEGTVKWRETHQRCNLYTTFSPGEFVTRHFKVLFSTQGASVIKYLLLDLDLVSNARYLIRHIHQASEEDMMHDIADLIYKRFLKGKAPPLE
jgi:hypothetical protein